MKRIDILATKIRNCITDFLSQTDISEIKGNIYLFNGDKEINISISEVWEIAEEVSLEDKELGGYYDQVKSTLPEKDTGKNYNTFIDFFSDICHDINIKDSTRKNYFRTLDTLKEYAPAARFCNIDKAFVCGYELFLLSLKMRANTIIKHMKHLKKAFHQACRKGYLKLSIEELFSLCSVKQEKTFKESLTSKELLILYQYLQTEFETMADREKEILAGFLFSCLTGLRYSDICSVEYSNIKRIRNKRWLFLTMKKTGQKVFVPIEQMFSGRALGIMRLFHRTRGKLFHMPSNAVCNRIIKRIYKKLFRGKKNISFHTGRHCRVSFFLKFRHLQTFAA